MKKTDSVFKLGYGVSLAFYITACVLVVIIALSKGTLSLPVVIGFSGYGTATSLMLGLGGRSGFSHRTYKTAQCLLFAVVNVFIATAFDSAQVFVYASFFDVIICFVFLDPKLAKLQMAVSTAMLGLMMIFIGIFVQSAQSMIEFIFGSVATFMTNWVIIAMTSMIRFQHRQMSEQERSLDDLLKVVEAKRLEAKKATQSKTRFLANMSHEIRTPINSVIGMNEMILRESTEPDIREYAADVSSAAQSLLTIINDILDITKIEEGKVELSPVEYRLQKLISDVYNLMRFRALSKDLKFEVKVDESLPSVLYGDDMRLKQVLVNLLSNAFKYTHEGSVTFIVERAGDAMRFIVKDTGVGIKAENMDRLFNAFYRIDDTRNRAIEGTGLGLSITQTILELLGSRLCVQSVYGEGSEFSFLLQPEIVDDTPIGAADPADTADEISEDGSFEAPDAQILVVDDNEMNRRVMRQLLKRTRMSITEASNGRESLEKTKAQRFDIIFMDHMMPEMNGIEALHAIRSDKDNPCREAPIIALTANAVIGAKEMYFNEGFDGFLPKPVDSKRLERLVCLMLDEKLVHRVEAEPAEDAAAEIELPEVFGVDWTYARCKLPSDEMLSDTVKTFCKGAGAELSALCGFFDDIGSDEGIEGYRIKVHSMKSSALLIGAVQAGGLAMQLESATRALDRTTVTALHPVFAQCWLELTEALKPVCGSDKKRTPAKGSDNEIMAIYRDIRTSAEDMDVDRLDALADRLDCYSFEGADAETAERVKAMILGFEVEKLMELEV